MASERIIAPWDKATVEELNAFQQQAVMHPFTCGNMKHISDETTTLVATPFGWMCPGCDYTQSWAYDFMADGSWRPAEADVSALLAKYNQARNR